MRVLLVEEGWHSTLRLARGLHDAGFAVTVLTANGKRARCRHRNVDWRCGPGVEDARFVAHVDAMVRESAFDRVLPLTEPAMQRLWDAPIAWQERIFPRTEPWQRRLVLDKHLLLEHAASRGIPIPRYRRVDATFDRGVAARELGLPLVVKGATGSGGRRVRIVDTQEALAATLERAGVLGGEWIVQEHLASPTYLVGGVFRDGEPIRLYAGVKLAQYPPRTGGAIRLRSTRDAALVELGLCAVRELRWTGFASVDCVRRADGAFALLEVNPRLWGSHAAARAAGVELFGAFAQLVAGESPPAELRFADGIEAWIFPKYFRSTAHRGVRGALQGLRELVGDQGRDWWDPRFASYALRRERPMRNAIEAL
jgi:predicted ATP-grasp superfamily ATP-dependent carboligase